MNIRDNMRSIVLKLNASIINLYKLFIRILKIAAKKLLIPYKYENISSLGLKGT